MKSILKPLSLDTEAVRQPDGHPYDALNANFDKKIGSVTNEEGFDLFITTIKVGTTETSSTTLPANKQLIGSADIDGSRTVLFLSGSASYDDEIGILYESGLYESRVIDSAFRFDKSFLIKAEAKIKNDEIIVSWTDGRNAMRTINLDDLPFPSGIDSTTLNLNDSSEISVINVYPDYTEPIISITSVNNSGGAIPSGVVSFFTSYKTEGGNMLPYSNTTTPIPIIDEGSFNDWNEIDGCEANTTTTKSVSLSITNIDESLDKIVLGVIMKIAGEVFIYTFGEYDITSSSLTAVFTNLENKTTVPSTSYYSEDAPYETAKVISSINKKLAFANLTGFVDIDYQKYANNISTELISKTCSHVNGSKNYMRSAEFLFDSRSLLPNEVYAPYIAFKLKRGGYTYAYPIPQRRYTAVSGSGSSIETDTIQQVIADNPSWSYLNADDLISPGNIKYFHTRDTSINDSSGLGYWENANETYPSVDNDPNGDWYVWEEDPSNPGYGRNTGVSLHGDNVRWLKTPSYRTLNWYDVASKTSKVIGIKLTNIFIPNDILDKVDEVLILFAKRSVSNATTISQAILEYDYDFPNNVYMRPFDMLSQDLTPIATYITNDLDFTFNTPSSPIYLRDMYQGTASISFVANNRYIRNIINPDLSIFDNGDDYDKIFTAEINNGSLSASDSPVLYSAYTTLQRYLTSLCIFRENVYAPFSSQELVLAKKASITGNNMTIDEVYNVDVFNSDYGIRSRQYFDRDTSGLSNRMIFFYPCMSSTNIALRHTDEDSTSDDKYYYPKYGLGNESWFFGLDVDYLNLYDYNTDYSSVNDIHKVLPKPLNETSLTRFGKRIILSDDDTDESTTDGWRDFLANNYYDMPTNRGDVTNMVAMGDEILINTTRSFFKTIGAKQLKVQEVTTYIGSGELFATDPKEQSISKHNFSGCQHMHSCVLTPAGYFYVNDNQKEIFFYNGKLNQITTKWHKENLGLNLKQEILTVTPGAVNDINFDNPLTFVGYVSEYDQEYNRIVLSKVDYAINSAYTYQGYYESGASYTTSDLVLYEYDGTDSSLNYIKGWFLSYWTGFKFNPVTNTQTDILDDRSWTMTYSLNVMGWRSWHSYNPKLMFRTDNNLYSVDAWNTRKLFKHNIEGKYGLFYDQDNANEFYVEFVINTEQDFTSGQTIPGDINKLFQAFEWMTDVYDSNKNNLHNKTFTQLLVYSDNQCSSVIDLSSVNMENVNSTWRFNDFYDLVVNHLNKSVSEEKGLETGSNTSSEKLQIANINLLKPWYEQGDFIGKFIVIRFAYDNTEQNEIYMHGYKSVLQRSYQ